VGSSPTTQGPVRQSPPPSPRWNNTLRVADSGIQQLSSSFGVLANPSHVVGVGPVSPNLATPAAAMSLARAPAAHDNASAWALSQSQSLSTDPPHIPHAQGDIAGDWLSNDHLGPFSYPRLPSVTHYDTHGSVHSRNDRMHGGK
jgi:hypothetical protein